MSQTRSKPKKLLIRIMTITLGLLLLFTIASLIEHFLKYRQPELLTTIPDASQLDSYLETQEKKIKGIIENTEKTIKWFAEPGEKTEYAIIYLHGFSATRQETAPVSSMLAKTLGANAYYTRLAGHGLDDERMVEASLKNWKLDTLEAYEIAKKLGNKIIIVSVSTGSTLSTWLMGQLDAQESSRVAAQILISPNFETRDKNLYILDWPLGSGLTVAKMVTGNDRHEWKPHNQLQDKYWSNHYHIRGLRPLAQLMKEVKSLDKSQLATPSLFIYSTKDTVVSTAGIEEAYKQYGSTIKKLVAYDESDDPSNHVLAGDILSPKSNQPILDIMLQFLKKNEII